MTLFAPFADKKSETKKPTKKKSRVTKPIKTTRSTSRPSGRSVTRFGAKSYASNKKSKTKNDELKRRNNGKNGRQNGEKTKKIEPEGSKSMTRGELSVRKCAKSKGPSTISETENAKRDMNEGGEKTVTGTAIGNETEVGPETVIVTVTVHQHIALIVGYRLVAVIRGGKRLVYPKIPHQHQLLLWMRSLSKTKPCKCSSKMRKSLLLKLVKSPSLISKRQKKWKKA